MNIAIRLVLIAVLVAAVVSSETLGANFSLPTADGWYTWQVDAVDGSELELFALMESGQPVRFRARGKSICSARITEEAFDLGRVSTDASISWLQNYIRPVSDLSNEVILLISLHGGDTPVAILEQLLAVSAEN
jgi:hypothetical protein